MEQNDQLLNFLQKYIDRGLTVIPLRPRSKSAFTDDWPRLPREELLKIMNECLTRGEEINIGIRLDNLTVLDLERPELWNLFFSEPPETIARYTWVCRTGGGGYHVYFRGETETQGFKVNEFVELRSSQKQYVVCPPSLHPDTGNRYEWLTNLEEVKIAEVSPDALARVQQKILTLKKYKPLIEKMAEVWRPEHRHNISLALAGILRKCNLSLEEGETILKAIVCLAHDEEIGDRLRALSDSFMKPLSEIVAWSKLKEELASFLGPDKVEELFKFLPKKFHIEVRPLSEVVAEARPIDWIIKNLFPKYGLVILAGKAGVGKSFLSLHLAHCVASGESFLGILPILASGKVLIIDNENYPGIYRQRVEALKMNPLDGIDVAVMENFFLDREKCLKWLEGVLEENRYRLIIFDAWTNLVSKTDENKATDVSHVLSRLRKISYDHECCLVLIHHLRKNLPFAVEAKDELRGSSVLVNEADIVLLLQAFRDSKFLRTIKQRYGEEQAFEVVFEKTDGGLAIKGRQIIFEEAQNEVAKALEAIIEYLEVKGNPATRRELIEALPFPEATIKRGIELGVNLGRLVRTGRGIYALPAKLEQFA